MKGPWPADHETLVVAMGCFWDAERLCWKIDGVYSTVVGDAVGMTPNSTDRETCTSMTGHTEAVLVVFDPNVVSVGELLAVFWENHDPTQYMGQGNDVGSQYRSAVYAADDDQFAVAIASRDAYRSNLASAGFGDITTEITGPQAFFYAESNH
jgi:peptide-methionine (S)-S-oxide reductase